MLHPLSILKRGKWRKMQKTSNYSLKKPDVHDPLRVEDFNGNADKIDAALAAVPKIVTGTYNGNGKENRVIELGFTPKALLVCNARGAVCYEGEDGKLLHCGGLVFPDKTVGFNETIALAIVDGGFQVNNYVGTSSTSRTNSSGMPYYYVALC